MTGCIIFAPYSAVSSCIAYLLPAMLRKASLMISSTGSAASIFAMASAASLWLYPSDTSAAMAWALPPGAAAAASVCRLDAGRWQRCATSRSVSRRRFSRSA